MILHRCQHEASTLYTLFDSKERVVIHPTAYFRHLRKVHRPVTSQHLIANVVKLHCEWLENSPFFQGLGLDEALAAVANDDILDWINDQRNRGITERTIHNREVLVKEMYRWFTTDEAAVRKDVPWQGRNYTRQPHTNLPRFVTPLQVIMLLNGMHNESQRVATHFLYDTGVRISEMIRLTQQHLPNESHWPEEVNYYPLLIPGSKSYDGSPYKFRHTIISRPMLARVRRYHATLGYKLAKKWGLFDPAKPLFLNVHGESLTKDSVYKGIKEAWVRQNGNPKEISPHRLRHGTGYSILRSEFGKELLDNLLVLKGMLGHENIKTTEIYSAIPIAALQSLSDQKQIRVRYQEADEIYQATYLPERKHVEKRGHRQ